MYEKLAKKYNEGSYYISESLPSSRSNSLRKKRSIEESEAEKHESRKKARVELERSREAGQRTGGALAGVVLLVAKKLSSEFIKLLICSNTTCRVHIYVGPELSLMMSLFNLVPWVKILTMPSILILSLRDHES